MASEIKRWYVWPKNAHTNEWIGKSLELKQEEDFCGLMQCSDGEHSLWQISSDMVNHLEKSVSDERLGFQIYVREGSDGEVKPWSPENAVAGSVLPAELAEKLHKAHKCSDNCHGCVNCKTSMVETLDGPGSE